MSHYKLKTFPWFPYFSLVFARTVATQLKMSIAMRSIHRSIPGVAVDAPVLHGSRSIGYQFEFAFAGRGLFYCGSGRGCVIDQVVEQFNGIRLLIAVRKQYKSIDSTRVPMDACNSFCSVDGFVDAYYHTYKDPLREHHANLYSQIFHSQCVQLCCCVDCWLEWSLELWGYGLGRWRRLVVSFQGGRGSGGGGSAWSYARSWCKVLCHVHPHLVGGNPFDVVFVVIKSSPVMFFRVLFQFF